MTKSTRASAVRKPRFPLWLHTPSGQWCKKVRRKVYYFGRDQDEALKRYLAVRDDLEAGRPLRDWDSSSTVALTLLDLCNHFAAHKKHQRAVGELSERSLVDYLDTCARLLSHYGKGVIVSQLHPSDLLAYRRHLAEKLGVHALGNEIGRTRVVLKFAFDAGLIKQPVRFGEFKRPKKSAFRRAREDAGERMFEAAALRAILAAAGPHLRAMVLLGVNAGFGNADCGTLPLDAVDLVGGWLSYPRPKTGIVRRAKLWPETVQALARSIELRPTPKDPEDADLVFLTKYGHRWHVDDGKRRSAISFEFRKLLGKLKLYRKGLSFYTLRHVFQTIADETGDETAVRLVMGHADGSMSATYRERFADDRLIRVADHVREWIFNEAPGQS